MKDLLLDLEILPLIKVRYHIPADSLPDIGGIVCATMKRENILDQIVAG